MVNRSPRNGTFQGNPIFLPLTAKR